MITIIAAVAKNGIIGSNGSLPWKLPSDMKNFKRLTTGNTVIMGRKTYESIGYPLPGRYNIVLSKNLEISSESCITADNLTEALKLAPTEEIFVIGGGNVYKQTMSIADRMILTEIDAEPEGDTFFPKFSPEEYSTTVLCEAEDILKYRIVLYERAECIK